MTSHNHKPYLIFLTGASGAGKTTLINQFKQESNDSSIVCLHFDSIGIPSENQMIKDYGSTSEWQKAMIYQWINRFITEFKNKKLVIFEGQVNLDFIIAACKEFKVDHTIILVHCDDSIRHQRLYHERKQPDLINEKMDNWSHYLKRQAIEQNAVILDTTFKSIDEMMMWLKEYIHSLNVI